MGWLVVMMVAVPLIVIGGVAAYWINKQAQQIRLIGGDPEMAQLSARAVHALSRLSSGKGVASLPPGLQHEVRTQASELVSHVLPDLLERRRALKDRLSRWDAASLQKEIGSYERQVAVSTDEESRRLLEANLQLGKERLKSQGQIQQELHKTELCIRALVGNVEALEDRLTAGVTTDSSTPQLESAGRLLEELKQVQTEYRKLSAQTRLLSN